MDVLSVSPLRATSIAWQPHRGAWALTVVVKATYGLSPVVSNLCESQEYPSEEENHWDDDPARSLYSPSDLAPFKPGPEVMVVGHAFAPRGEPVSSLVARIVIGDVDKSIEAFADQTVRLDGSRREGPRFVKMPLRYERAAGGPDTSNPVGMRLDVRDQLGAIALPNWRALGAGDRIDWIEPVGFGPVAADWPARKERSARLVRPWAVSSEPLPDGLDPRYFMAAPRDQALSVLRADERIILENLHTDHPRFVTNLSGIEPRAFIDSQGRPPWELKLTCDTLWIDTDRSICTLTWRGQAHVDSPLQPGRVVVAMEQAGRPLSWLEVEPLALGLAAAIPDVEDDSVHDATATQPIAATKTLDGPVKRTHAPAWLDAKVQPDKARALASPPSAPTPAVTSARTIAAPDPRNSPSAIAPLALPWSAPRPTPPAAPKFGPAPSSPAPPPLHAPPPPPPARASVPGMVSVSGSPSSLDVGNAVKHGAAAASNAAASSKPAASAQGGRPERTELSAPSPAASQPQRPVTEHVDLVWFDPQSVSRVRALFVETTPAVSWLKSDAGASSEPQEQKDRREVLRTLARGKALDDGGLSDEILAAFKDDGTFQPPLVLVGGELCVVFDEIETLRATITVTTPFLGTDKKLREVVTLGMDALKSDLLGDVADGLTARIEEAFVAPARAVAPSYLQASTERILLEGRRYQKKTIRGERRIRTLLTPTEGNAPIPTYFPEAASAALPIFRRFKVRAVVEVRPQEDQYESHRDALVVLALGRSLRHRRSAT
jgi:hypothetical protein